MSRDWFRCDEGFTDLQKNDFPHHSSKRRRSNQGRQTYKRLSLERQNQRGLNEDLDLSEITWTSSENDDDHQTGPSSDSKRHKPTKRKRKSNSASQVKSQKIYEGGDLGDEPEESVIHSDNDSRDGNVSNFTNVKNQTEESLRKESLKRISPVEILDIESEDSRSSFPSQKSKNNNVMSKDESSPAFDKISTCSTSTLSPSQRSSDSPRVKASDWLKSLSFKTPTKASQYPVHDDSAKKKKKYKRGGFAEQLSGITGRQKSSYSVWKHSMANKNDKTSKKMLMVKVERFQTLYSLQICHCTVLSPADHITGHQMVMFTSSQMDQLSIQLGSIVEIFPPWQELDLKHCGGSVLLCTQYSKVISDQAEDLLSSGGTTPQTSPKKVVWYRGSWKCPCVTGLTADPRLCLATKFPCVPGLNTPNVGPADSEQNSEEADVSSLHMIMATQATQVQSRSTDSILEWVDLHHTSPAVALVGFVHRVIKGNNTDSAQSYSLLLQDSHNTVCLIHCPYSKEECRQLLQQEGKCYEFSGLDIQDRTNRDRDPALFSVIDRVWMSEGQINGSSTSYNQESEDMMASLASMNPPEFCYVLKENPELGFSCKERKTADLKPPDDDISDLSSLHGSVSGIKRISMAVRVLYILNMKDVQDTEVQEEEDDDSVPTEHTLYVTDNSMLKDVQQYTVIKVTNNSNVINCANIGDTVILRDVMIDRDAFYCDIYSCVFPSSVPVSVERLDLPYLSTDSPYLALCKVEGVISEVDESSAYSWDVCDKCFSENLAYKSGTRELVCLKCKQDISSPLTKMKLKVGIRSTSLDSHHHLTVELQQSTIEELLPEEADEEGYDVGSVMDRSVGPLTCICAKSHRRPKSKVREIHLLEINLSSVLRQ